MVDPERRLRQSSRWQDHDYTAGGTYFVTIVTSDRACLFGDVRDGDIRLNAVGRIVDSEWMRSGIVCPEVDVDLFCVMPNHLHGLVTIRPSVGAHGGAPMADVGQVDLNRTALTTGRAYRRMPLRPPRSLGSLVAGFKRATTMRINAMRGTPSAQIWPRGGNRMARWFLFRKCLCDRLAN
jgi:hypothetical protein